MRDLALEDFGGGTGDVDNTPALNGVGRVALAEGGAKVRLGVGVYRFASKPDDFTACVKIIGEDKFRSRLMRCYSAAAPREGFLTWREAEGAGMEPGDRTIRASELRDCQVTCSGDSHGGTLVLMMTDGPVTGWGRISRVKISHDRLGGSYARCLRIDGRANVKPGGQGFRDVFLEDLFLFVAPGATQSASFLNCTNLCGSLWASGDIAVTGNPGPYGSSTYGRLSVEILGSLIYDYASRITSVGNVGQLIRTANSSACRHYGVGAV